MEGELRSRLKENDYGTKRSFVEIKATQIQFLDKKTEDISWEEENAYLGSNQKGNLTELENMW